MEPSPSSSSRRGGRGLLWLGVACAALGPVLYFAQLRAAERTDTPWYAPALATLGAVLVLLALARRPGVWRGLVLVLVAALAGFQWWFLTSLARLPAYAGPVAVGQPFPAFAAARADGTPFARADLEGGRATALVFFRGHW
jgi:hypothetical protein